MNCRPLPYQGSALPLSYLGMFCLHGGERRIRTFEGFSRQIYSLIPLTAWVSPPGWSWQWDSNPQPADYKSAALPIELRQHDKETPARAGASLVRGALYGSPYTVSTTCSCSLEMRFNEAEVQRAHCALSKRWRATSAAAIPAKTLAFSD